MAQKIRKGDQVVVLSGRDKGRKGAVLEVLPTGHVIVEALNVVKRHTKSSRRRELTRRYQENRKRISRSNRATGGFGWNRESSYNEMEGRKGMGSAS